MVTKKILQVQEVQEGLLQIQEVQEGLLHYLDLSPPPIKINFILPDYLVQRTNMATKKVIDILNTILCKKT